MFRGSGCHTCTQHSVQSVSHLKAEPTMTLSRPRCCAACSRLPSRREAKASGRAGMWEDGPHLLFNAASPTSPSGMARKGRKSERPQWEPKLLIRLKLSSWAGMAFQIDCCLPSTADTRLFFRAGVSFSPLQLVNYHAKADCGCKLETQFHGAKLPLNGGEGTLTADKKITCIIRKLELVRCGF